MGVQAICSNATKICQDATLTPPSLIMCQSRSFKPENKQREHQAIDQTRMCSMVVYIKVYYWIVPLLSVLFECWGLGDILYPRIPINAPIHRQTAQPVSYIKPRSFLLLFPPRKKSECKSWGIYKPIYAVLNYIIILLIHLSRYANNPFAQKSISKAQFETFRKNTYPQPIFKPFFETPSTLKVIIDYKPGWA